MVRARKHPTGDLDRLRELLNGDGLILPPIPHELGTRLRELGPWHFATPNVPPYHPYNFFDWVYYGLRPRCRDFLVLAHAGYGINSWALPSYMVRGPLRLFLQLSWGGVYTNEENVRAMINSCFGLASDFIPAMDQAVQAGRIAQDQRIVIAASGFYGSRWFKPGERPPPRKNVRESWGAERPHEILQCALRWLQETTNTQGISSQS